MKNEMVEILRMLSTGNAGRVLMTILHRYDNSKRLQPWQQKQQSSQHKGRGRTNSPQH